MKNAKVRASAARRLFIDAPAIDRPRAAERLCSETPAPELSPAPKSSQTLCLSLALPSRPCHSLLLSPSIRRSFPNRRIESGRDTRAGGQSPLLRIATRAGIVQISSGRDSRAISAGSGIFADAYVRPDTHLAKAIVTVGGRRSKPGGVIDRLPAP